MIFAIRKRNICISRSETMTHGEIPLSSCETRNL